MSRRFVIAAAALALLAALPSVAAAAPGWTVPTSFPLPANALASSAHVGYQTGGTATIAYLEVVSESPIETVLHVGVIPPGGSYQEQLRIASTSTALPANLAFAEAPDGAAVLEWIDEEGAPGPTTPVKFLASYRPAGSSTWEAPVTLASEPTHGSGVSPTLVPAISTNGTAAAGLDYFDPTDSPAGYKVAVAVHPAGGGWGTAQQISPTSESSQSLALAFDGEGNLTAAFQLRMSNLRFTLAAMRKPASNGTWGSLEDVTGSDPTSQVEHPELGVAPDGSAVIAFQYVHYAAPGTLDVNAVTRSGANAPWTSASDVVPGGSSSSPLAAGVSPDNRVYILYSYQGTNSGLDCVGAVEALIGGLFSTQCVSPTSFESGAGGVAFLGEDAYFAWSGTSVGSSEDIVQGSRWLDGFYQPEIFTNLDSPGEKPEFEQILPDQDGSIAAFWSAGTSLRAAAFDAGAPILLGASVPTSAATGQAVAFAASYTDLWSGLGAGQPTWSFGDGSAAVSGASVTHAFATAGTYTITLSAADAFGNATSTTYSIKVSAPNISSPPLPPRPTVTLALPACPKKLSKKACKRYRASRKAWQTLSGTVVSPGSAVAGVQVVVYRTHGKTVEALAGGSFRKTTKAKALKDFVSARVKGTRWSLALPKLKAGSYTILVRATNKAGRMGLTLAKALRLS